MNDSDHDDEDDNGQHYDVRYLCFSDIPCLVRFQNLSLQTHRDHVTLAFSY